ncbi:MAG TPA: GNAT family N-acetyltransferase [Chloroflexi bacterium]|nr:GNAT family N-acetyltransferase [Chloroflexota bacterium]
MSETTDLALVAQLLADDPVWAAYAIADLQPAMTSYCRWFAHADGDAQAVALLFTGLKPPILFAKGDPAVLATALDHAALPSEVYLSVRAEHAPIIARRYNHHDRRWMWRMVLGGARGEGRGAKSEERGARGEGRGARGEGRGARAEDQSPISNLQSLNLSIPQSLNLQSLRRLTGADVAAVEALFQHGGPFTPDAFAAHQIEMGVFYGVEDASGALAAVGGTHIVDYTARLAAIGNMYTRPDCRGRGLASTVLAAIVASLQAEGVETIVLNVDQRNVGARRIYERFGFVVHCPFIEGVATARI